MMESNLKNIMRAFIFLFVMILSTPAFSAQVLDPYLRMQMSSSGQSALATQGEEIVSVFIKTGDYKILETYLKKQGGAIHSHISSKTGDIVTADVLVSSLSGLEELPGIVYVEQSKPLRPELDLSLPAIGVPPVHAGTNLPQAYTGKGVIVGVVDSGIYWEHDAFKGDLGKPRVLALWDQTLQPTSSFKSPSEIADSYGIECLPAYLSTDICPSRDTLGHGTHVAGIAVAGEFGYYPDYVGVAPAAELVVVKAVGQKGDGEAPYTPTFESFSVISTHIVDGVDYVFKKADALNLPAVVNLSIGGHVGAHDGTSLFEQALNGLVEEKGGRVIVAAAGNDNRQSSGYFSSIHAGYPLNDEALATEFVAFDSQARGILIDLWQPADSNLSFGIGIDSFSIYEKTELAAPGETKTFSTADGELQVSIDATETSNPLNGKKHTLVSIVSTRGDEGPSIAAGNYIFDLMISGTGNFDAWLPSGGDFTKRSGDFSKTGLRYLPGDSRSTVGLPATAKDVISVASFSTRDHLSDFIYADEPIEDDDWTPLGDLSPFSSPGPALAPEATGQKPEIAAPGEQVASALSADARFELDEEGFPMSSEGGDGVVLFSGTSMAAPHVAGAVALLLERQPTLTTDEIKHLLYLNADVDDQTGSVPNNGWGFGKLNVEKTMENFETTPRDTLLPFSEEELPEQPFEPDPDLAPAARTSGGCSLLAVGGGVSP